jgi:hypothetical protein
MESKKEDNIKYRIKHRINDFEDIDHNDYELVLKDESVLCEDNDEIQLESVKIKENKKTKEIAKRRKNVFLA